MGGRLPVGVTSLSMRAKSTASASSSGVAAEVVATSGQSATAPRSGTPAPRSDAACVTGAGAGGMHSVEGGRGREVERGARGGGRDRGADADIQTGQMRTTTKHTHTHTHRRER